MAATTWLAAPASTGLCALVGASSDDDLTPRLHAQAAGQVVGGNSGFSGLSVSAVREAASTGLEELSDPDDDEDLDVLSVLFRGVARFDAGDEDDDLDVGDDVQVGVRGGDGGLGGGVGVSVSLRVSLGVSPVAALPPPSPPPPSSPDLREPV